MQDVVVTKHPYASSNRVGMFRILHELLQDGRERPLLQALFGLCVVLHTEPCESGRGVYYIAASDLFEELREGEEIPEYRIEMAWPDQALKNPAHELTCTRSADGRFRFKAIRKIIVRVPPASLVVRAPAPGSVH